MSSRKKKKSHRRKNSESTELPVNAGAFLSGINRRQAEDAQDEGLMATYHIMNIQNYLKERSENGQPPVSEEEINEHFQKKGNKKFEIKSIPGLRKALKNNPRITYNEKLYSYRVDLEIFDRNQLLETLEQEKSVKLSDLQGAYKGFEKDLAALVEEGKIGQFNSDEDKKNKLYYYFDPELKARQAPQYFRDLWKKAEVPDTPKQIETRLMELGGKPMELVEPFPTDDDSQEITRTKRRVRRTNRISRNQELLDSLENDNK
ncbi:transcription initiation factor IIE subunit beta-like [Histomonas meleagridis]|uniref:transcription initiation factor IIE subunit beta-like n=1 Tax=Histomonas meleagridis TaxID=135588 RepID=UPI00355A4F6F|nr:transcription initiation factor IIE subunit beta-like [Histomonas meleagridis]KAH0801672.1 transcription initiation factor IIE subunit beta-like [Histomonas meleagridis]